MILRKTKLERFNEYVLGKYQLYNTIFMTLPFDDIYNTGTLLPLFSEYCKKGYEERKNPTEIVTGFFNKYIDDNSEENRNTLLFKFIQYIERQVVLFDAIEDAYFQIVHNMDGIGTLRNVREKAEATHKVEELKEYLQHIKVRPVLTAHPTQFYPGTVLGIITDLSYAIEKNDDTNIRKLLAQLGKTPFFKKKKPTPLDEAISLIWYLENVFYHSAGAIYKYIYHNIFKEQPINNEIINLGFWPGGDRDGNPFVTPKITVKVAKKLRLAVLKSYYRDLRSLKRRITFEGVDKLIAKLEKRIYETCFTKTTKEIKLNEVEETLQKVRKILIEEHQSLFLEEVDDLLHKVTIFGFHFASLDIRQDSRVHHNVMATIAETTQNILPQNYRDLTFEQQLEALQKAKGKLNAKDFSDEITHNTIASIYAMKSIQKRNGEKGCNRYIISNNQTTLNVLEAFTMIRLCEWEEPTVDIVPLFETVDDLKVSDQVMQQLYHHPMYKEHLKRRGNIQTIMLGFSDGTKDGGYLMANWSIYKAKERLTEVARNNGIKVIFFDGRGGPPARGGGKSHQFYASLGSTIEAEEVQLTIQGQTISSNFGTLPSSQYNLEQLLSAGINNKVFSDESALIKENDKKTMQQLAEISYKAYSDFKAHPKFLSYLEHMSTLKYYAKTNIGSRPSKRGSSKELNFSDLRAIPFVGSWSQLKQNVPGFFGVGTALHHFEKQGEFDKVVSLYQNSLFFRTLLENSMMSLTKSFFKLTEYMKYDEEFGSFWSLIFEEYQLSKKMILKASGNQMLMEGNQSGKASIQVREKIVLPLLTIQQYALKEIQQRKNKNANVYEKMVTRSLFGNINASRNSA